MVNRIKRHDRVASLLGRQCGTIGWRVRVEPTFTLALGKNLRPDLVAYDANRAIAVDVTITYETNDRELFRKAYDRKVAKYTPLRELIVAKGYGETVTFHGLVIGCRGAWPEKMNALVLKYLLIRNFHFEAMLARRVLLMSCDILRSLGDGWVSSF